MNDDLPPELREAVSEEDRRPFGARRKRLVRLVVYIALAALVVPIAGGTVVQAERNAQRACAIIGGISAPQAEGTRAAFELFGRGGPGWQCYSTGSYGGDHLAPLGLIPGLPTELPERRSNA